MLFLSRVALTIGWTKVSPATVVLVPWVACCLLLLFTTETFSKLSGNRCMSVYANTSKYRTGMIKKV